MSHSGKQWSTQRYSIQEANPSFSHKWVHHSWKSKSAVYLYIDDAWCFDYMAKIAGFRSGGNGLSLYRVTNWSVKKTPSTLGIESPTISSFYLNGHTWGLHMYYYFKGCSNVITNLYSIINSTCTGKYCSIAFNWIVTLKNFIQRPKSQNLLVHHNKQYMYMNPLQKSTILVTA